MNLDFQSISDQGAVRPNNEDAIKHGISGSVGWMVIADGMGGHQAGEVASKLLVDEIEAAVNQLEATHEEDYLCFIELELNRANNKIFSMAESDLSKKGMGTTAVLVLIFGDQCYLGWVGDSRCYHYKKNEQELVAKTRDHTMVQALFEKGAITKEEVKTSKRRNMLTRAIGIKKGVKVDTITFSVESGDILFLSTDGLHDNLEKDKLNRSIKKIAQGQDQTKDLVKLAIQNESKDNITFGSILIK